MSIMERLTALFAPDDCLGCGREGSLLCAGCAPQLPALVGVCFGCYRYLKGGAGCTECLAKAGLGGLVVGADYEGPAKLLIACLKFRGNQAAARIIAKSLSGSPSLIPGALLVNIPATAAHVRERGFDQAALIARDLSRRSGLTHMNLLRRIGSRHQLGADREQRLRQLSSSISVRSAVLGRHIILVDDVLTTGASLGVAAGALRAAGATRVDGLVFAQSLPKSRQC